MSEIRGCAFPEHLLYDADLNLWFEPLSDDEYRVGITPFGAALVGDLYMFNPKPLQRELEKNEPFALIEVAKTIITVRTPFASIVTAANEPVQERPIKINRVPLESWLVQLRAIHPAEARQSLLPGNSIEARALELMDLNRFTSLEEFQKTKGNS
jgi:glycine cleavage system H protein